MAKQKRKPASKPITSHQLFPAVVALWFGALFGLGSLAVRPSLLESVVMASRIDLVIPAAAPPLGVTARILVALVLAAIGSTIGLIIARRLTRPKPEVRERKRTKLADREEAAPRYTNHPAFNEAEDDEPAGGILAQRRRALTIEHDEEDFVPHEMAPLPGGAPQILDISKVGFDAPPPHAPLDLGAYQSEPVRQEFQPQPVAETAPVATPVAAEPAQPEPQRQIFGQPVAGDHIDQTFVQAAGFKTTVFDTETPEPLFPPRMAQPEPAPAVAAAPAPIPPRFGAPEGDPVVPQFTVPPAPPVEAYAVPPMAPDAFAVPAPVAEPDPAPVMMPEPAAMAPAPVAAPVAAPISVPVEPLPSPAGLGMTDLASRLAESMARRRAARAAAAGTAPAPVEAAPALVVQADPAPVATPVMAQPAMPAPPPFAMSAQPAAPIPAPFAPFAAAAAPEVAPAVPTQPPVAPITIPAAMRPLDLGGFEDEAEPLSSLLPPRHITMPAAPVAAPEPAPQPAPEPAPFAMPRLAMPEAAPAPEPEAAEDTADDEPALDDKFGSLLGVAIQPAGPRAGLVRIEEPEAELAEIEPVVIFPGQMVRPQAEESAPFRRFDAPANAEQGQPIAADQTAPAVDREEAERALRMALANLQRMSGAA